jgi:hypothetical protein
MGNQGEVDGFGEFDRINDVGGLGERDVFGATDSVVPRTYRLLSKLCCISA